MPVTDATIGEILVIDSIPGRRDLAEWHGMEVEVIEREGTYSSESNYYVQPLTSRPDEHGMSPFYWDKDKLIRPGDTPKWKALERHARYVAMRDDIDRRELAGESVTELKAMLHNVERGLIESLAEALRQTT